MKMRIFTLLLFKIDDISHEIREINPHNIEDGRT